MKRLIYNILLVALLLLNRGIVYGQDVRQKSVFEFCGNNLALNLDPSVRIDFAAPLSEKAIHSFYTSIQAGNYKPVIDFLISYKEKYQLNDWIYYQLIRKTAEQISPKGENYERYTLYKWFFLCKSGYDATLGIAKGELLMYIRSDEEVSDIPYYTADGKQYICLNSHDYRKTDLKDNNIRLTGIHIAEAKRAFSYKVTQLPDFRPEDYTEKDLDFNYRQKAYHFKLMLNPEVETIFANYPVVDFESYFNIPLSRETYRSLIPSLKKNVKSMSQKKGVDYLMNFTRNAFLYEDDDKNFGKEKRLSPEQTLFYGHSDCDDRAALFFYLVKEIYNLPMITLLYPTHVTMAVQFDKSVGRSILYKGKRYSVCEPTPQQQDLKVGQLSSQYQNLSYQVVYQYDPVQNPRSR